jgi:hypothetical protein
LPDCNADLTEDVAATVPTPESSPDPVMTFRKKKKIGA